MTARRLEGRIHPDDLIDPGRRGPQVMRHVTVNVAESPLAWLATRGHVSDAQLRAGERLRADYERAGLAARVTMRWDAAPLGKSRGGARAADASLARSTRTGVSTRRSTRRGRGSPTFAGASSARGRG